MESSAVTSESEHERPASDESLVKDDIELFKRWLTDTVFALTYEQTSA